MAQALSSFNPSLINSAEFINLLSAVSFSNSYFNVVSLVFALYLSTADAKAPPKLEPATPIKKGKEDDKAML